MIDQAYHLFLLLGIIASAANTVVYDSVLARCFWLILHWALLLNWLANIFL
jgi:hypothetical protein